jgi:hypothetical protein
MFWRPSHETSNTSHVRSQPVSCPANWNVECTQMRLDCMKTKWVQLGQERNSRAGSEKASSYPGRGCGNVDCGEALPYGLFANLAGCMWPRIKRVGSFDTEAIPTGPRLLPWLSVQKWLLRPLVPIYTVGQTMLNWGPVLCILC